MDVQVFEFVHIFHVVKLVQLWVLQSIDFYTIEICYGYWKRFSLNFQQRWFHYGYSWNSKKTSYVLKSHFRYFKFGKFWVFRFFKTILQKCKGNIDKKWTSKLSKLKIVKSFEKFCVFLEIKYFSPKKHNATHQIKTKATSNLTSEPGFWTEKN